MRVQLDDLKPNPFRDFDLDPIDDGQVQALMESIGPQNSKDPQHLGFWGGIAVRRDPQGSGYQLAFGHHRVEALRRLGWKQADLNLVNYPDWKMAKALSIENTTQRHGTSDVQDAVAGAIRALGYELLCGNEEKVGKIFPTYSPQALGSARGLLLRGEGLGWKIIHDFFGGTISEGQIKSAVAGLKTNGKMIEYLEEIQEKVAGDEEAEKAAEAAVEKAKEEQPVLLHPAIATFFPTTHNYNAVKKILSSEFAQDIIPVEDQPEVCRGLIEHLAEKQSCDVKDVQLSNDGKPQTNIRAALNGYIDAGRRWLKTVTPEPAIQQEESLKLWRDWNRYLTATFDCTEDLRRLIEEGGNLSSEIRFDSEVTAKVANLKAALTALVEQTDSKVVSYQ